MTFVHFAVTSLIVPVTLAGFTAVKHVPSFPHTSTPEDLCRQYEADGVLGPGSCDCTAKLFDNWDSSYDWKDSCAILHEKERTR